jgi:hypothetical protein
MNDEKPMGQVIQIDKGRIRVSVVSDPPLLMTCGRRYLGRRGAPTYVDVK